MKYYLQVQKDKTITDVINYPYKDYIEHEFEDTLVNGLIGGWFKYENGEVVEYPDLKSKNKTEEMEGLKSEIASTQIALMELAEMVLGGVE